MRFTLAACLALTALCAVLCFLLTTKPNVASYFLLIIITILAPVCAVAGIVYGRDNLRAFCIGAAFPLALLAWSSADHLRAISLDPAAYGWPTQGQTGMQSSSEALAFFDSTMSGLIAGDESIRVVPGMGPVIISQAPRSPGYDMTLQRAIAMTHPTCSLSIAAVVCGVLVMAIRGGLARKERETTLQPSAGSL